MFEESLEIIKNSFMEYKGTGSYIILYCLAVLYIFLKEKDKQKRAFAIYFPIFVLVIVMNPLFNKFIGGIIKKDAYFRVFWLVPVGVTIAYACTMLVSSLEKKTQKIFVSICFIGIIALSGKYMFTNGNFIEVGNPYKIFDESVYVTQLIGADEADYKKALVSSLLVPYMRQIDGSIELTYGRNATSYSENSLATILGSGDVEKIATKAKSTNSNYIVMFRGTELTGSFEDYGYELLHETDDFDIYKIVESEEN